MLEAMKFAIREDQKMQKSLHNNPPREKGNNYVQTRQKNKDKELTAV